MLNVSTNPKPDINVSWSPQPGPQTLFVNLPPGIQECLYGGSRGGGKTDAAMGFLLIMAETYGEHFTGLFFRKTLNQLTAVINRTKKIYPLHGAVFKESKKTWEFPNGAKIIFAYLDTDADAENYQGWSVQAIVFEELTNFPNPNVYKKMMGILRPAGDVKIPTYMLATANPGGPGHGWVKRRFIDPAPGGFKIIKGVNEVTNPVTGDVEQLPFNRLFIPAKVTDNKLLMKNDPGYVARLAQTGSEQLVQAWLHGLWDIVDGAYFPEFSTHKHVIKNQSLPDHWTRFRCGDWGYAKPFAFYWVAVASETINSKCGKLIPQGSLVFYREWYGIKNDNDGNFIPNEGCRMFAEEIGEGIAAREKNDPPISYGVLDPSSFARDGGYSIEERLSAGANKARKSIYWTRADNKRIPGKGAIGGWDTFRARLIGDRVNAEGGKHPHIFFTEQCIHAIRTIPEMQHDEKNVEDLDTDGEDHCVDAIRYGIMSRPIASPTPAGPPEIRTINEMTLNELWEHSGNTHEQDWRI